MADLSEYQSVIDKMFQRLPMFSRVGAPAYKPSLENTIALCTAIENPEQKLRCIHIAGTNGKGSVSHWLASILQEAGYKTGLYTSPHLNDFRERIRVDGEMIPEKDVVEFYHRLIPTAESVGASFFEMTVAMALGYFQSQQTDWAIIETGMGGRLDSTNVITPELSIITHIDFDHQAFLGNTLEAIATEKAGIIKPRTPILIGRYQSETKTVFAEKATTLQAPLLYAEDLVENVIIGKAFQKTIVHRNEEEFFEFLNPLNAQYQSENIATVVAAIDWLNRLEKVEVSSNQLIQGLEKVVSSTQLRGRWQLLKVSPRVIADVAHNEEGIQAVLEQLKHESYANLHIVYGAVKDKDVASILRLLPKDANYYFCEPPIERKMPVEQLAKLAADSGLRNFNIIPEPKLAYQTALYNTQENDLLLIMGSFFVVGEIV